MRRWATVAVAATALCAAACGGSKSDAVSKAGDSVGRIHSGVLHVKVEMTSGAAPDAARVGFQMDGPFDADVQAGQLPVADLTTKDFATGRTTEFVSDRSHAFLVVDGVAYQFDDQQVASLRRANGGTSGALTGLDLRSWVVQPTDQPSTTINGQTVARVTGTVDPVAAINGIVALATALGSGDQTLQISAGDADRVRAALKSSSFELLTGAQDGLLRQVTATMAFASPQGAPNAAGGAVLQALAGYGHLTMTIQLGIDSPNGPVSVTTPASSKPIAQLPRSSS